MKGEGERYPASAVWWESKPKEEGEVGTEELPGPGALFKWGLGTSSLLCPPVPIPGVIEIAALESGCGIVAGHLLLLLPKILQII